MTLSSLKTRTGDLSEPPALSEQLLRRLWLGLPIAGFGLLATLLAAGVLLPLAMNLRTELERAQRLQRLQDQLLEVNTSLARSQAALKQADNQTSKLRSLLVGGGDRGTVLATLDNDAKATGVSLTLYEQNGLVVTPGATPAKPGTAAAAPGARSSPPPGTPATATPGAATGPGTGAALSAVASEGVVETPLLLSVQGSFPQILAFLRQLERLQVLVKQQDLSLAMVEKPAGASPSPEPVAVPGSSPKLVMKLSLVIFDAPGDGVNFNPAANPSVKSAPGPLGVMPPTGGQQPAGAPAPAGGASAPNRPAAPGSTPGSGTPGSGASGSGARGPGAPGP